MTFQHLFWSIVLAGILLLAGTVLAHRIAALRRLFLPGSIVAGCLALALGPQGVGWLDGPPVDAWKSLPGTLINIVFAAIFLGSRVPGPREIWRKAGPQMAFGQTLAWGQYVVGLGLAALVLVPFFGISPLAGTLIEVSFEGGHGTAAGMAGTFRELGFPEGADLALALATVGLVTGILLGTALVNWAARKGHIRPTARFEDAAAVPDAAHLRQRYLAEQAKDAESTDPLSAQFGVVALAIGIGWLAKEGLLWLEPRLWGRNGGFAFIRFVPLFPLAMIGGIAVQVVADRTGLGRHINRRLMNRISGTALDFTIVAAMGTLSLASIGRNLVPFLILAAGGIFWAVACLLVLAPRIIPTGWFERGIGDFGQSTGVTVTGLLLMRMADPCNRSGALESFAYKQLLFEPIVGGGLFTAAAPPLVARFGLMPVLWLTAGLTVFWILFGLLLFGRGRPST